MSERLEVTYKVTARGPKGAKIPGPVAREVFDHWAKSGRIARGFDLHVAFRNPDRKGYASEWKWDGDPDRKNGRHSLSAIRKTLRLGTIVRTIRG